MSVANSRVERDAEIGRLANLSQSKLLHELVTWTVNENEIADESREIRRRRAEARTMRELVAGEIRARHGGQATTDEGKAA
jgi:hypothetical protein